MALCQKRALALESDLELKLEIHMSSMNQRVTRKERVKLKWKKKKFRNVSGT
jgi:hypothetical protein